MYTDTIQEFLRIGRADEANFAIDYANFLGGATIEKATFYQDVLDHFDVIVNGDKIDVKGIKRIERGGNKQAYYHWVEFRNVKGEKGWLYGKADYIVFATYTDWIIVEREKLVKHCLHYVIREKVFTQEEAVYKVYQRKNRKDLCSLIPIKDLEEISKLIIRKKSSLCPNLDVGKESTNQWGIGLIPQ